MLQLNSTFTTGFGAAPAAREPNPLHQPDAGAIGAAFTDEVKHAWTTGCGVSADFMMSAVVGSSQTTIRSSRAALASK